MIRLGRRADAKDPDHFQRLRSRRLLILSALPFVLAATALLAIFIGSLGPIGPGVELETGERIRMSFGDAFDALIHGHGDWPRDYHGTLWSVRIPRVLLAGLVGASLACAGTAMQAVFRNPMADPYIVGVSSGASLGAVAAGLAGLSVMAVIGPIVTPLLAFTIALMTVFLVYFLGTSKGRVYVDTLLLSGVAVAIFLDATRSFLIYYDRQEFHRVIFWLLGSFALASWPSVAVVGIAVAIGAFAVFLFSRDLNALLLGEETAHNLGTDPEFLKTLMLIVAAVMTAAAVAFTGVIGFVGLVIPHMARLVVGADHRVLVFSATLSGAVFMIWADALARTVISPSELPVGIITAMCGGPFFVYLLRRNRARGGV
ncbi:MAG: FecCD family ABC transporter permease [Thermoplasmata archaeon]